MAANTYKYTISRRTPRARSKRLRELGIGSPSGTVISVSSGGGVVTGAGGGGTVSTGYAVVRLYPFDDYEGRSGVEIVADNPSTYENYDEMVFDGLDGDTPSVSFDTSLVDAATGRTGQWMFVTTIDKSVTTEIWNGLDGKDGTDGKDGEDGKTPTITMTKFEGDPGGVDIRIDNPGGATYEDFIYNGEAGYSPTASVEDVYSVEGDHYHRLTITDKSGTTFVNIMDGEKGDTGAAGADGAAATVTVGTTVTANAGTLASVTNSGTTSAAVLDFRIPRGEQGEQGVSGDVSVGRAWLVSGFSAMLYDADSGTMLASIGLSASGGVYAIPCVQDGYRADMVYISNSASRYTYTLTEMAALQRVTIANVGSGTATFSYAGDRTLAMEQGRIATAVNTYIGDFDIDNLWIY